LPETVFMPIARRQHAIAEPWRSAGGLRIRMIRYQPGTVQPRHCHADAGLSLVVSGTVEETASTTIHHAQAGSLVVKPAECWHANLFGPRGAQLLQVLPQCACDFTALGKLDYRWLDAPRLTRAMLQLWISPAAALESAELAFWETITHLHPSLANVGDPSRDWWSDALDLLNAESPHAVSVAAIARRVGVHPVHLARVCRRKLGCTVREYLRQRRTLVAWRACEERGQPLSVIAARCGFADQSHMTRAFTRELGISPARLQRLLAASDCRPAG
jgi:AraC family transcriptional regulator